MHIKRGDLNDNKHWITMFLGHKGKCVEGEFRCENGNECLPIAYVLDGIAQCSDKSDEGK